MSFESQSTYDSLLLMKDAGLIATGDFAQVGGVDKILDLGAGLVEGDLVIDVSAIEVASNDELYTIIFQGSDSADFSAGTPLITNLAILIVGAAGVQPGAAATSSATGRYIVPVRNEVNGHVFRYARIEIVVAGTIATGINFTAFLGKDRS